MTFKEIVKLTDMGFTKDDIMKLTKDEPPKDEHPKDEHPKDEHPKDEPPKDEPPKDEPPKDESPKDANIDSLKSEISELKTLIAEMKQTAINTIKQPEVDTSVEDVIASIINPPMRKE